MLKWFTTKKELPHVSGDSNTNTDSFIQLYTLYDRLSKKYSMTSSARNGKKAIF